MKLKKLFSSKRKWTQGELAKDSRGNFAEPLSNEAVCWCLLGAIEKCYGRRTKLSKKVLEKIDYHLFQSLVGEGPVAVWNDDPYRKFRDIKKLVDTLDI